MRLVNGQCVARIRCDQGTGAVCAPRCISHNKKVRKGVGALVWSQFVDLLTQNLALKSSEHVRNADETGECVICRTQPL